MNVTEFNALSEREQLAYVMGGGVVMPDHIPAIPKQCEPHPVTDGLEESE